MGIKMMSPLFAILGLGWGEILIISALAVLLFGRRMLDLAKNQANGSHRILLLLISVVVLNFLILILLFWSGGRG
jgi:hypothetical protein